MARSSKESLQQRGHAWSCHLPRCTQSIVWHHAIESLGTVTTPGERSIVLVLCNTPATPGPAVITPGSPLGSYTSPTNQP
jgi:hypothetical protein